MGAGTELLDISRLELGRLVLRRQLVDVRDVATLVVETVGLAPRPSLPNHGVRRRGWAGRVARGQPAAPTGRDRCHQWRLDSAGLDMRPGELLMGVAILDLVALVLGWALAGPVLGLLLAVAIPVVAMMVLRFLAQRRQRQFSNQLAETLQILSGSLRAGHGLAQGIDAVAREAESPTAEEFRRLTVDARLGRDFIVALTALADRVGGEDFEWVVEAIEIQRDVGGDLAEVLDTVADTIRDRIRIRRQASALSAEGRMSAWVLLALPFGLGLFMALTNPTFLSPLLQTGKGNALLGVGAVLMSVGALWLRKIVKPVF